MGQVMQRAGGAKVTVEGLTADVVKSGETVTVKQGNKLVDQVVGALNAINPITLYVENTYASAVAQTTRLSLKGYSHISISGDVWTNADLYIYLDSTLVKKYHPITDRFPINQEIDIDGAQELKIVIQYNVAHITVIVT